MASQGPLYPGTVTQSANAPENAEAWVNPGNISADDGTEATITAATFDSPDISNRLAASNFGFTIPGAATIDGIVVEIDRRNSAGAASDNRVQLRATAAGGPIGTNKADTALDWPASLTVATYGSSSDTWSAGLTVAQINGSEFGVVLSVQADAANTDVQVDFVRVTVHYTAPENHDGSVALTGGGVVTPAQTTNRNRAGILTAGGVLAAARAGAHQAAPQLVGGGILSPAWLGGHTLALVTSGGGVLVIADEAGGPAENHDGTVQLVGGGILTIARSPGHQGPDQLTASGILQLLQAGGHLTSVQLTGGGVLILQGGQSVALDNLGTVMDCIATALTDADVTKRAYPFPPDTVEVPCVVVGYPATVEFDVTYQRGADRCVIPIYFLVGRVVERAARDQLTAVITGATGVKDVLDGNLGGCVQTLRVMDFRVLMVNVSGVDYLAGLFNAEVIT